MIESKYKNEQQIDMSERLRVEIVDADADEMKQNRRFFDKLNKSIKSKIEEADRKVNSDIKEIANKDSKSNVEISHFIEIYNEISKNKDIEHLKDKSYFYRTYMEDLENEEGKKKTYKLRAEYFIIYGFFLIAFFILFVTNRFINNRIENYLPIENISISLVGITNIVIPFFFIICLFNILTQGLLIKKLKRKYIYILKYAVAVTGIIYFFWNFSNALNLIDAYAQERNLANEITGDSSNTYKLYSEKNEEKKGTPLIENNILKLYYEEDFINSVAETYESIDSEYFNTISCPSKGIVAKDTVSGKEYTAKQLFGENLLIPYKDAEKEVYFYGKYNKNNNWDGICVFNIYEYDDAAKEAVLKVIMEARYDNGNLLSYKKIFKTVTGQGENVWSISNREIMKEANRGETWNFFLKHDYLKDFDLETVELEDLIYVDDFENILKKDSLLEGYYCGDTLDGYYNDNTGDAYMVKYSEDGKIRTLYKGCFEKGYPSDQTGDAWQIVYDSSSNKYFYYKGEFKGGKRKGRVTSDNYITQEEREQIIEGMTFNCILNWYNENETKEGE